MRTVDRAVRRLREEGFVEPAVNYDEAGGQVGNSYRLKPRQGEALRERIRPDP